MGKLPEQSRAQRVLFEPDPEDQPDYAANLLEELISLDRNTMAKRWNFDSQNETALEGRYQWFRRGEYSWVEMKPVIETLLEEEFVAIEKENEMTPKSSAVEAPAGVRKKRDDSSLTENGGKRKIRKINFD